MFKTTIDLAAAVSILVKVVREFGADHIPTAPNGATGCAYTTVGVTGSDLSIDPTARLVPVCIVGQVFAHLGILRALFRLSGSEYTTCDLPSGLWDNAATMGVEFTEEARQFLRAAQMNQDRGIEWGEALSIAFQEAQDAALANFKANNPLFTYLGVDVSLAVEPVFVKDN